MTLDIQSPKGQATLAQERKVIDSFHRYFPNHHYVETDKDRDAVNDGVIYNRKTGTLIAVCETKCRDASHDQMIDDWDSEWLITYKKIERNAFLAREMRVLFTGILYLTRSDLFLMKNIYDGNLDKWLVKMRTAECETQKNINGGRVVRNNAFIDMSDAAKFRIKT